MTDYRNKKSFKNLMQRLLHCLMHPFNPICVLLIWEYVQITSSNHWENCSVLQKWLQMSWRWRRAGEKIRMRKENSLLYWRYPGKGGLQQEYYGGRTRHSHGEGTRLISYIFTTVAKFLTVIKIEFSTVLLFEEHEDC